MTEDKIFDGAIHGSVYSYGATKRMLYTGILAYNDQFKLNGSYIIPPAMFGENDDFNEATAHVPSALIARFVKAVKTNSPEVEIWGDGTQVRDLADVKDFVNTLLDLAPKLERDIVNVAPGRGKTIWRTRVDRLRGGGLQGQRIVQRQPLHRCEGKIRGRHQAARKIRSRHAARTRARHPPHRGVV